MAKELVSKKTRIEYREWLVGTSLRRIEELFDGHGIACASVPLDELPGGQRRSLVEQYYASVDWSNPVDVGRVLAAYEDIMVDLAEHDSSLFDRLVRLLNKDGYEYRNYCIVPTGLSADIVGSITSRSLDVDHLEVYADRIKASMESDPAQAIGVTKELLEATLKTVLDGLGEQYTRGDDIPKLLRTVQKALKLAPDDIDEAKRGADIIRRTLSNLGAVVVGVAELRNLYGTGHGRSKAGGLRVRHARLVVGSGCALCRFLLDTYEVREG